VWAVWAVWGSGRCGRCGGVGSLLTFDIPQTALVATLDTYDFYIDDIFDINLDKQVTSNTNTYTKCSQNRQKWYKQISHHSVGFFYFKSWF
jgi:hypothetical protein